MAVAEAWCVTNEDAVLAMAVPTTLRDTGALWFNLHRIYGAKNFPYLATNWKFSRKIENYTMENVAKNDLFEYHYQPLYLFNRINEAVQINKP